MANTNLKRWGIQPLFMAEARKSAILLPFTNNYGTIMGQLDPVVLVTAGTIERGPTSTAWCGVVLELFQAPVANQIGSRGLVPVQYMAATPGTSYTYFALVAVDPTLWFSMQEDGAVASIIVTDLGGAADIAFTNAVTATAPISGAQIDSSSIDGTATRPIQVITPLADYFDVDAGAYNTISADASAGNYCKFIVRIFNHQFSNGAVASALS